MNIVNRTLVKNFFRKIRELLEKVKTLVKNFFGKIRELLEKVKTSDIKKIFRKISEYLKKCCTNICGFLKKCYKQLELIMLIVTAGILGLTAYILDSQLTAIQNANLLEIVQDLSATRTQLINQMDGEIWQYLYDNPESDPECTIDNIIPFGNSSSNSESNPHKTCLLKQRYLLNVFNYYYQIYLHYKEHGIDGKEEYTTLWEITLQEEMRAACILTSHSAKLQEMFNLSLPSYSIQDMKTDFENWGCIPKTSD